MQQIHFTIPEAHYKKQYGTTISRYCPYFVKETEHMKPVRSILLLLLIPFMVFSQTSYNSLVNPFIGTGGHGHIYPGAGRPFGMMQPSPDTRLKGWDGCSGYHYSDLIIY